MTPTNPPEDPRQDPHPLPPSAGPTATSQTATPPPSTPPPAPPPPPAVDGNPPPPIPRLLRDPSGPIRGVATGIANYFGFDPVLAQLAFVALTLFGGSGLLIYLAGWLLIPEADSAAAESPGSASSPNSPNAVSVVVGALILVAAIGLLFSTAGLGFAFDGSLFVWLFLLGAGVYLLNQRPEEVSAVGTSVKNLVRPTQPWAAPQTNVGPAFQNLTSPASQTAVAPEQAQPTQAQPAQTPPAQTPPSPTREASGNQDLADRLAAVGSSTSTLAASFKRPPPPEQPDPSPPITSMTLALAAIAVGVLAAIDQLTSASVDAVVLFGAVLAVCGLGLIVASVKGRAWGLLPVAFIATVGVMASGLSNLSVTVNGGLGERLYTVETPAELEGTYELAAGELTLDLSQLDITTDTTIETNIGAGAMLIIVPSDTNVDVTASARFGSVQVFERSQEGVDVSLHKVKTPGDASDPTPTNPTLTILANATFGEVEIRHAN